MADKVHNTTQGIVNDIKSGLHGIHGAGEAIRGGAMEALDGVFHKKEGEAKNREIYERGAAEMRGTEHRLEGQQSQHGFGPHHEQARPGSHFADAHARDVHANTTTTREAESLGAAKLAWQEKH
ncbi:hypothetical protein H2200_005676 [Cladophialophora chaetospira]|uniref:Uncharacterized protein n=1 Tax=Cladophialophora chaetospira TaxID=386627 RepID=A0AA38X9I1_9EURO|nr:hypothetical protein H2200_005676 [Cladophialophora chaetospira]